MLLRWVTINLRMNQTIAFFACRDPKKCREFGRRKVLNKKCDAKCRSFFAHTLLSVGARVLCIRLAIEYSRQASKQATTEEEDRIKACIRIPYTYQYCSSRGRGRRMARDQFLMDHENKQQGSCFFFSSRRSETPFARARVITVVIVTRALFIGKASAHGW